MPAESDERLAKLKAAINQCRDGDLSALLGIEMGVAELVTISALAKATGDAFTYRLWHNGCWPQGTRPRTRS